jgi:hypothetical protein
MGIGLAYPPVTCVADGRFSGDFAGYRSSVFRVNGLKRAIIGTETYGRCFSQIGEKIPTLVDTGATIAYKPLHTVCSRNFEQA